MMQLNDSRYEKYMDEYKDEYNKIGGSKANLDDDWMVMHMAIGYFNFYLQGKSAKDFLTQSEKELVYKKG